MAVTGVLAADFSQFFDAVQKAEVQLKGFETGASKVESQLSRMTDGFSGRKVIQEATLMAEAIERGGGTSKLTAAELERVGLKAAEAADKMRALGMDVPASIDKLATSVDQASTKVGGFKGEMQRFDGILASMGINISPFVRGLEDIAGASGKSVLALGFLGTAGAVLATAMAAWKIGRATAEFFDFDTQIANATARLKGYGDVVAETAGAKQDTINRAIAHGAAETINYADAIQFNIDAMQRSTEAVAAEERGLSALEQAWNASAEATAWAADEGTVLGDVRDGIIQSTGEAIAVEEAYRSNLKFTTETVVELADSYDILMAKQMDQAAKKKKADEDEAARVKKLFAASYASDIQTFTQAELEGLRGNDAANMLKGTNGDENLWAKLAELEADEGRKRNITTQADLSKMMGQQILLSQLRQWAEGKERPPGFKDGVENFDGGLAYVHRDEMLVNLPKGTDVIPAGRSGGMRGGTVNQFNFNMSGMVGDKAGLARMIESAFREMQMNQGSRLVARA